MDQDIDEAVGAEPMVGRKRAEVDQRPEAIVIKLFTR